MKLAFGKTDITPHLPVQLSGFSAFQVAYEVHDPLYARMFLFEDEGKELLWLQTDLACFDEYLFDLISEKTVVPREQVIASATHTHSGPGGIINTYGGVNGGLDDNLGGPLNAEYCHRVAELIGAKVRELRNEMEPFAYRLWKGKVTGVGTDRHDPALPADEDAVIIEWTVQGRKALLLRMSCHATVLNGTNQMITADFPGQIEPLFPEYEMVAFFNGSAGDMSTRFTRRENTFEEAARYGKLIEAQVRDIISVPAESYESFDIELKHNVFRLPVKKVDSSEEAERKKQETYEKYQQAISDGLSDIEVRLALSVYEGACNAAYSAEAFRNLKYIDVGVTALKLPQLVLIFTPVEMFSKLSNPLKKYGIEHIGYSNGYLQYMPDKAAYELNYYETQSTPYAYGAGEQLMEGIVSWLGDIGFINA